MFLSFSLLPVFLDEPDPSINITQNDTRQLSWKIHYNQTCDNNYIYKIVVLSNVVNSTPLYVAYHQISVNDYIVEGEVMDDDCNQRCDCRMNVIINITINQRFLEDVQYVYCKVYYINSSFSISSTKVKFVLSPVTSTSTDTSTEVFSASEHSLESNNSTTDTISKGEKENVISTATHVRPYLLVLCSVSLLTLFLFAKWFYSYYSCNT